MKSFAISSDMMIFIPEEKQLTKQRIIQMPSGIRINH